MEDQAKNKEKKSPIFSITIEIASEKHHLHIFKYDTPSQIAYRFCIQNNWDLACVTPVSKKIQEVFEEYIRNPSLEPKLRRKLEQIMPNESNQLNQQKQLANIENEVKIVMGGVEDYPEQQENDQSLNNHELSYPKNKQENPISDGQQQKLNYGMNIEQQLQYDIIQNMNGQDITQPAIQNRQNQKQLVISDNQDSNQKMPNIGSNSQSSLAGNSSSSAQRKYFNCNHISNQVQQIVIKKIEDERQTTEKKKNKQRSLSVDNKSSSSYVSIKQAPKILTEQIHAQKLSNQMLLMNSNSKENIQKQQQLNVNSNSCDRINVSQSILMARQLAQREQQQEQKQSHDIDQPMQSQSLGRNNPHKQKKQINHQASASQSPEGQTHTLYERGVHFLGQKMNKIEQFKQERQDKIMSSCTFVPQTNQKVNDQLLQYRDKNIDPYDQLYQNSKVIEMKKAIIKNRLQSEEVKEFSFKPALNPISKLIMKTKRQSSIGDNAPNFEAQKNAKITQIQQEMLKECTFHPQISKQSQKIRKAYNPNQNVYDRLYTIAKKQISHLGNQTNDSSNYHSNQYENQKQYNNNEESQKNNLYGLYDAKNFCIQHNDNNNCSCNNNYQQQSINYNNLVQNHNLAQSNNINTFQDNSNNNWNQIYNGNYINQNNNYLINQNREKNNQTNNCFNSSQQYNNQQLLNYYNPQISGIQPHHSLSQDNYQNSYGYQVNGQNDLLSSEFFNNSEQTASLQPINQIDDNLNKQNRIQHQANPNFIKTSNNNTYILNDNNNSYNNNSLGLNNSNQNNGSILNQSDLMVSQSQLNGSMNISKEQFTNQSLDNCFYPSNHININSVNENNHNNYNNNNIDVSTNDVSNTNNKNVKISNCNQYLNSCENKYKQNSSFNSQSRKPGCGCSSVNTMQSSICSTKHNDKQRSDKFNKNRRESGDMKSNFSPNKNSVMLMEKKKRQRFEEIFRLMDTDKDGLISAQNISIQDLPDEILVIIAPLLYEIEDMDAQLNLSQFVNAFDRLFRSLTLIDKNKLLLFHTYQKWQQEKSQIQAQNQNFQPSINPQSEMIAQNQRPERGQENLYDLYKERDRICEEKLMQKRREKENQIIQQCTFHPNVASNYPQSQKFNKEINNQINNCQQSFQEFLSKHSKIV